MNVLVVGSGAREHALAWKLRQSPKLSDLFVAPGNAGTAAIARNLDIKATDREAICRAARDLRVDLAVIGPEQPLADGLVDRLAMQGIAAFGPSQTAARIESSKAFAKELMQRHGIPTAAFATFSSRTDARNYVLALAEPPVIKADGLAAGKGAFICGSQDEAIQAIDLMMGDDPLFGEAGRTIIIEQRLSGREVSAHAFTDGVTVAPMPFACDYKRARDADQGPNTGGMGAYSPAPWLDEPNERFIHQHITEAAVRAMFDEGIPYRGVLYPGLMVTDDGPHVLEFNCRFGDPEAQVLLPRLKSDLLEICWAVANNRLHEVDSQWSTDACVGVVLTSGGYPDEYQAGFPISGLASVEPDVLVFHAGTQLASAAGGSASGGKDGSVITSGGRVLTVVATAPTLAEARARAYRNVQRIHFSRCHYRRDIAAPAQNARVE